MRLLDEGARCRRFGLGADDAFAWWCGGGNCASVECDGERHHRFFVWDRTVAYRPRASAQARGLTAEDLQSASPNQPALTQMNRFAVSTNEAERYAREARLATINAFAMPGGKASAGNS